MPSLQYSLFSLPVMSDKKSPPRKEKPLIVRTPQSDDKGMKRKLLAPGSPSEDDDKKTPSKRKRGSMSLEASPLPGAGTTPKSLGNVSRIVPLSERQQLAMIMKMADESSQGAPVLDEDANVKPPSPTTPSNIKKTPVDRKVHKRNERGELPIHLAAIKGDVKLIKKLIKAGADVNVADFAGWTALHEACNHGWLSVAKQLLKSGANVNVQGLENDTPLHDASGNGHKKLVELLLKHGANPLQMNSRGKTPLDVAASPEMVKLLKREVISSSSDSSSLDDLRSPMSPDSVCSLKEEDRNIDVEDVTHSTRSDSFTSVSSNSRRTLLPKSPDNKMASPRLCLKFQRELSGQVSQKAKDSSEPQYKSYSVTSVTVESETNQPMFSPMDSPASSIDSDLYNPMFDSSSSYTGNKLKISVGENLVSGVGKHPLENTINDAKLQSVGSVNASSGPGISNNRLEFDGNNSYPVTTSAVTTSAGKLVLKSFETQPFSPMDNFSEPSPKVDTLELPDLEPSTSHIPRPEVSRSPFQEQKMEESVTGSHLSHVKYQASITSSISSSLTSSTGPNNGGSYVSSTSLTDPFRSSLSHPTVVTSYTNSKKSFGVSGIGVGVSGVSSSSELNNTTNSFIDSTVSVGSLKRELRSSASPRSEDGSVHSSKSDSVRTSSPTRVDKDGYKSDRETRSLRGSSPVRQEKEKSDRESRPSSPKVPPLKIIIPTKSSASSSSDSDGLKLTVTKSALPYVINPTQDQECEKEGAGPTESRLQHTSQTSSPTSQPPPSPKSPTSSDKEKSAVSDKTSGDSVPDKLADNDKENSKGDSGGESKKEEKKEEPTQRVLRSAVRSQQQSQASKQQQQQKQEKTERSSNADTAQDNSRNNKNEEEDLNIHPRKRKLRPKSDNSVQQPAETTYPVPVNPMMEKPPNPYEMYLAIRKRVAMKRQGMANICPKIPQGFKDYLLKTCNYVLQGNTSSTLNVPTLSPPNSVKGPIRELFVKQEQARYKLRLQHLIEREKLILSIEQEILREHGRAARAMVNQGIPLSVCTILKDEEIYNSVDMDQAEDKEKNVRSRYNGRQFLSWLQDVDDKYEKIKELLILRQKQEADSLYAVQKMEWEWNLKELGQCDRNTTPEIDELHVPLVQVTDNFDLLPT